ncbi:uncharacterized protein LOC144241421 [Crocuta crocuta]
MTNNVMLATCSQWLCLNESASEVWPTLGLTTSFLPLKIVNQIWGSGEFSKNLMNCRQSLNSVACPLGPNILYTCISANILRKGDLKPRTQHERGNASGERSLSFMLSTLPNAGLAAVTLGS